mgnify:CR=1 FL=1
MNIAEFRDYCIKKEDVEETFQFGQETLVFKITGKMFLFSGINGHPVQFNVKCDPEKALELRADHPNVLPGYHMNKKHWNTVVCDGSVSKKMLLQWIDDSYDLVAKKKTSPRK